MQWRPYQLSRTPEPDPRPDWPQVLVNYTSRHRGGDWRGSITWAAVLDTDSMTWLVRVPVEVTRVDAAGTTVKDILQRLPDAPGVARFAGHVTGFTLEHPCAPGNCRIPPAAVLDALAAGASTPGPRQRRR